MVHRGFLIAILIPNKREKGGSNVNIKNPYQAPDMRKKPKIEKKINIRE